MTLSAHALAQAAVWGTDPEGWAHFAEPHNRPLFKAVLDAAGVGTGSRLLDVGCGTGAVLAEAERRGAAVTGIDVADPLLAIARKRLTTGRVEVAELDELPFPDATFDAVVGVNSFQFAADPHRALREARRVLAPGGRVVASLFAAPERSESTVIHHALNALVAAARPAAPSEHKPYALSLPGNLEAAFAASGLTVDVNGETQCVWAYASPADCARGLLASAGGAEAASVVGPQVVADAVVRAAEPFTAADGTVRMHNTFRWVRGTAD